MVGFTCVSVCQSRKFCLFINSLSFESIESNLLLKGSKNTYR